MGAAILKRNRFGDISLLKDIKSKDHETVANELEDLTKDDFKSLLELRLQNNKTVLHAAFSSGDSEIMKLFLGKIKEYDFTKEEIIKFFSIQNNAKKTPLSILLRDSKFKDPLQTFLETVNATGSPKTFKAIYSSKTHKNKTLIESIQSIKYKELKADLIAIVDNSVEQFGSNWLSFSNWWNWIENNKIRKEVQNSVFKEKYNITLPFTEYQATNHIKLPDIRLTSHSYTNQENGYDGAVLSGYSASMINAIIGIVHRYRFSDGMSNELKYRISKMYMISTVLSCVTNYVVENLSEDDGLLNFIPLSGYLGPVTGIVKFSPTFTGVVQGILIMSIISILPYALIRTGEFVIHNVQYTLHDNISQDDFIDMITHINVASMNNDEIRNNCNLYTDLIKFIKSQAGYGYFLRHGYSDSTDYEKLYQYYVQNGESPTFNAFLVNTSRLIMTIIKANYSYHHISSTVIKLHTASIVLGTLVNYIIDCFDTPKLFALSGYIGPSVAQSNTYMGIIKSTGAVFFITAAPFLLDKIGTLIIENYLIDSNSNFNKNYENTYFKAQEERRDLITFMNEIKYTPYYNLIQEEVNKVINCTSFIDASLNSQIKYSIYQYNIINIPLTLSYNLISLFHIPILFHVIHGTCIEQILIKIKNIDFKPYHNVFYIAEKITALSATIVELPYNHIHFSVLKNSIKYLNYIEKEVTDLFHIDHFIPFTKYELQILEELKFDNS